MDIFFEKYCLLQKLANGSVFLRSNGKTAKMPIVLRIVLKAFLKVADIMHTEGFR